MNAIDFECPTCGAKPGERCHTLTGKMTPVSHSKRKRAVLETGAPYLVPDGNLKRCSVCGFPFAGDVDPISVAFANHLDKAHEPGQTTEDMNQAAARTVTEATEEK